MPKARYDLEDRTLVFARHVRSFVRVLPRTVANQADGVQLIRSSGSVGANYIEANDSLGKKDFLFHIKICRKESKRNEVLVAPDRPAGKCPTRLRTREASSGSDRTHEHLRCNFEEI
ncbi:MAG: four helix bundle protein [Ignavibacteria bacterium]|nr:four helix bundle protein [Ignavibacteria bacterium]